MKPISKEAALKRIATAEITLAEAFDMTDAQLLRLPTIGRRTLHFIRTEQTKAVIADLNVRGIKPTMTSEELMKLTRG